MICVGLGVLGIAPIFWGEAIVTNTPRALALVMAFIGLISSSPAYAVTAVPNPGDFLITESPGQYTVFNNSNDWYVFAFAVSNPNAALPTATATTSFSNWGPNGLKLELDLNTNILVWAFGYASPDANLANLQSVTLNQVNLSTYIGPNSSSNQFFFSPPDVASNWGMLVINADGVTFGSVNGVIATPLPGTLPLFASGVALIGLFVRKRKQSHHRAVA
jgi:hypothetical protein